jgi:hypothetical protein
MDTFEVAGVDMNDDRVQRYVHAFDKRAVSPEDAAKSILKGVERNHFLIYTSNDIRFGYWWARKFAPPYEFVMQWANNRFSRFLPPA